MAQTTDAVPAASLPEEGGEAASAWRTVGAGHPGAAFVPLNLRRMAIQLGVGMVLVLATVGLLGVLAARQLAEREAVNDAAARAGVLADALVQPALTDSLLRGDAQGVADFDTVVRRQIKGPDVVRVKLWRGDGKVLYADEPQLIGRTFPLSEDQSRAIADPSTVADISNLGGTENVFERGDRLIEVYRPMWTESGQPLLFELYTSYEPVASRTTSLWRGFAGVTLSSLFLLVVLMAPIVWRLVARVREGERARTLALERAVEAGADERRRIAATLHDGPVQELVGASLAVAGAAHVADRAGDAPLAAALQHAATTVRSSIGALRTLLVDIYPPGLAAAGLTATLADLAEGVRRPDLEVVVHVDPEDRLALDPAAQRVVHQVAQECLRNAARHAGPATVLLTLSREDETTVVLDVVDDGRGFDVDEALADPAPGHFGLRLLADAAALPGALLQISSRPGAGTHWRLALRATEEGP